MTTNQLARVLKMMQPHHANDSIRERKKITQALAQIRPAGAEPTELASGELYAALAPIEPGGQLGPTRHVEVLRINDRDLTVQHQLPISARQVRIELDDPYWGRLVAVVDLTWCRFNRQGQYTSGGRFVEVLSNTE